MQDYEPNIDQLLTLYQQLEDDIIASMIRRMLKMGYISESTKYEAEILQASGLLYEDILRLIAERTDATVQQVRALFEDAGVQTVDIDNEAYEAAGEVPIDIRQDKGMKQILEAGYRKTLGTMQNLVSTTATQSQTAFIAVCDRAYMQVSSGAFSYQQAIRQAVKSFGDIGAMVQYLSGHRDRLDVAMRRAVLTGVGQTSSAVALEHAKKSGCYLMELTAHSGARPEHAAWQGQLVSLNGKDVGKTIDGLRVHSLSAIGYGTGAGFKGWNCRHNWHPYYPGLSTPNYTKAQLAKLDAKDILYDGKLYTEYEISQKQREAERRVRALKRRVVASQTAVQNAPDEETKAALEADYTQNAVSLKAAEKQLRDFCKATGRRNDTFRTQVDGFGRSEAQKAVQANKRAQNRLTSGTKSGTINTTEMTRAKDRTRKDVKAISDERFRNLTIEARKHGALVMRGGEEVESHLDAMSADASILGDVILFRQDVCVSEVLEETYHFMQNLQGMNDDKGEPLRTILNEIDAKKHLLDNIQKYGIPRSETELTQKQLEYYQKELEKYLGGESK